MKLALHEITTKLGTFPEHLAAYADAGWRHFEISFWAAGDTLKQRGTEATATLVREHGLTCIAATGIGLRAFGDEAARAADLDTIREYGEWMQALGCSPLVVGCDRPSDLNRDNFTAHLDTMANHMAAAADAAEPFGVQLAVEVNWCAMCRSFRTVGELLQRVQRANVGVIWDPAHFYSTPSRLADLDALAGRFNHAHLNDMAPTFHEVLDINGDRRIPGQGILPLREWTDRITATGYTGFHSVELFDAELWKLDARTIARKVMEGCRSVWPEATF